MTSAAREQGRQEHKEGPGEEGRALSLTQRQGITVAGLASLAADGALAACAPAAVKRPDVLRIALLHLAPRPGNLAYNRQAITDGVERAAALGADRIHAGARGLRLYVRRRHRRADFSRSRTPGPASSPGRLAGCGCRFSSVPPNA